MRTLSECRQLKSSYAMTAGEREKFRDWLDKEARYTYDSYDYCCWLGWYTVDEYRPMSPSEAGFD